MTITMIIKFLLFLSISSSRSLSASDFETSLNMPDFTKAAAGIEVPKAGAYEKSDACRLEDDLRNAHNKYKMSLVHNGPRNRETRSLRRSYLELKDRFSNSLEGCSFSGPAWLYEELEDDNGRVLLGGLLGRLKGAYEKAFVPTRDDLAINFIETSSNRLTAMAGRNEFWPALMDSMQAAESSIIVHIFGLQADDWGWEVAALLGQKARQGVKVHILADKGGARMTAIHHKASAEMFKFFDQVGVKYTFYNASFNPFNKDRFAHFDHRKYFIIDGKVSYTTGYTLEQHMRKEMFDLAVRAEGPVVSQMQASFFMSYFAGGGSVDEAGFDGFMRRYFPEQRAAGRMQARIAQNVPWRQHRVTESYYARISGARRDVYVINPYFTDDKIVKSLMTAAANGADVKVVLPLNPENALNSRSSMYHAWQLSKKGVKVFLYQGPEKFGRLHGKGILVDDSFVSIGSCNMDAMALYHNFEQNIESTDTGFAAQAKADVFERAVRESVPYVPENHENRLNGLITEPFDRID